ncbi:MULTISPECIES: aldehyde dehydrogenase family protein [Sphingobacterium]|uniref:aldehyde dehydrogenase family protein n=1 Tax=Sphingobacterium TaxID=28453 RepID=UPI0013D993CF|nr:MULTISPECIES: aldehyde dehydrogenase family protein [unclassified Sphingobacterium]
MQQRVDLLFHQQKTSRTSNTLLEVRQRIHHLKKLKDVIHRYEPEIFKALSADLRKSKFEAAVTEIYFVYSEIDFALKNLSRWVRPQRAKSTVSSLFTKNRIIYEPKGNCLIIAPWNYPFQLTMSPLVSALAAGNSVIIKPSEYSPHTAAVLATILDEAFDKSVVACIQGGQEVSEALLKLPFDHIFFTGSTPVGKIVMRAAAEHLSTITLELGGKSPVLIDPSADLEKTAEKVAWGKLINAGQTCIAPDYVLLHHSQEKEFIHYFSAAATRLIYRENGMIDPDTYAKIINTRHMSRLQLLLEDAIGKGAEVVWQGDNDLEDSIPPTLLRKVNIESRIMEEEIFGPLLPLVTYTDLDEALDFVQSKPKPLALYIFSSNTKSTQHIIKSTSAGGTCVNDVILHVSNPHLPFGGVNHSGMGGSHGYFGFKAFSHERSVMYQSRIPISKLIYPPYSKKGWVLKFLKRWM